MNEFMTLEEVARYLRLSVHTIYKMAQQKRIPAMKAGALWRFKKENIDEWMVRTVEKELIKNNKKRKM